MDTHDEKKIVKYHHPPLEEEFSNEGIPRLIANQEKRIGAEWNVPDEYKWIKMREKKLSVKNKVEELK